MDLSPLPILDAAQRYRGAVIDLHSALVVPAKSLHAGREQLATQLQNLGLESGQRVIIAVSNGPGFVASLLAVLAVGGSPLLAHASTPLSELERTANRFGAHLILTDMVSRHEFLDSEMPADALDVAPWLQLVLGRVNSRNPDFTHGLITLTGVPLHPTSGTTGVPKVAIRPGQAAIEEARHYIETIGVTDRDRIMAVAPMSHAYAFGMCVMVSLVSGASLISMKRFEAKRVLQGATEHGATILPAVPAMLNVLLFSGADRLKGTLNTVLSAGVALPERTASQFHSKTGIPVRPLYGTTETGGISVARADDGGLAGGCVGPAMRGVEKQVIIDSNANASDVGKLHIRSSSMMAGYLGKEGIDRSALQDGWFYTGDLAAIDQQDRICLKGREAHLINVEGLKVIPLEVEEVIFSLKGVKDVAVYAGVRKSGGQFVKAAVVLEPDVDVSSIRDHCQQHLVYYKCPDRIIPLEQLPRSPAGKILQNDLP